MRRQDRFSRFGFFRLLGAIPLAALLAGVGDCQTGVDDDGDGYTTPADCDDSDPAIHPDAAEVCDGLDNDCDRQVDEGLTEIYYLDQDGDGYGLDGSGVEDCEAPAGYVTRGGDCNDEDALIHPDAEEVCDGLDNNCDNVVDEGVQVVYYLDLDQDGYGDPATEGWACYAPEGTADIGDDCDDTNADVHPGATEVLCNGLDDDCDGEMLDPPPTTYYADVDGDGYGNPDVSVQASCAMPDGYILDNNDCDDSDANVHPGANETCNGKDDNCNDLVDEDLEQFAYYSDVDQDGFGDPGTQVSACTAPEGMIDIGDDCDDANADVHPGAAEICDGLDNDCNGSVDGPDAEGAVDWYADQDGDGYGNRSESVTACEAPSGYVADGSDCNDNDPVFHPGAPEDDCSDPNDYNCDGSVAYQDADGDGSAACVDCDDGDPAVYPGAAELCDDTDNDCDGEIDEGLFSIYYADKDGDTYGDPDDTVSSCTGDAPSGYVTNADDCNDAMWSVNPEGLELCNGMDDDCDGLKDSADTWADNVTGDLPLLNDNCDTFDRLLSGENDQSIADYWSASQGSGTVIFPDPLWLGGHTPDALPPVADWPADCTYYDLTLFYGFPEDEPDALDTRTIKLCFSKGTDVGGMDEVYAEMSAQGITVQGVLDNEEDDDGPELDYVFYSPEESTARYEVWYLSDSFSTSGGRGPLAWSITTEFYDVRIVLDLQPGS